MVTSQRESELQGRFKRRILREIQKYDKNKKKNYDSISPPKLQSHLSTTKIIIFLRQTSPLLRDHWTKGTTPDSSGMIMIITVIYDQH